MNSSDVMKLPNVKYGEKWAEIEQANLPVVLRADLMKVVWELATTHPQWVFYIHKCDLYNNDVKTVSVNSFEVRIDGDAVGVLWNVYYRNQHCIGVSNKRISAQMDRGDMKRTTDVSKAIQLAKKYFGKKTAIELLDEGYATARDVLNGAVWVKERKMRSELEPLHMMAHQFMFADGAEQFKAYLKPQPEGDKMLEHYNKYVELTREKEIAESVSNGFKEDKTCLVILDSGTYIVKRGQLRPTTYTDADLPDYLRGKIGLLKLVNAKQIIDGVGCRVDDKSFVVMSEEEAPC